MLESYLLLSPCCAERHVSPLPRHLRNKFSMVSGPDVFFPLCRLLPQVVADLVGNRRGLGLCLADFAIRKIGISSDILRVSQSQVRLEFLQIYLTPSRSCAPLYTSSYIYVDLPITLSVVVKD